MAGEGSKKDMEFVLTQAMRAGNSVKAQRNRLLHLQRRLQRLQAGPGPGPAAEDHNARLGVLATDLFKVYFIGLEYGARTLTTCIRLARQKGVLVSPPGMDFVAMSDEQLHDALLAQQFPARPTTHAQAIDRAMAALLAIKLLEEHLLPRCVECLVGGKAPVPGKPRDPSPDPAAATEGLAKADLSADDPDATATAKTGSKPRDADAQGGEGAGLHVPRKQDGEPRREAHRRRRRRPLPLPRQQEARQPHRLLRRPHLHLRGGTLSIIRF